MGLHIGIAGPISTESIARFIDDDVSSLPVGYNGAPFLGTLIGELLARGHQVSAYTTSPNLPLNLPQAIVAQGERFKIYYCPLRKHSVRMNGWHLGRIVDFFGLERRYLVQAIRTDNPDIVHAHWAYEFALASMGSGIPNLVTVHDDPTEVLKLYRNIYRFGRYVMARRVLRHAKAISVVSDDLKLRIAALAHSEICVISNPLSRQFSGASAGAVRTPPSLLPKKKLISVINGWGYLKNANNALAAFLHIRRHSKDITYHFYGVDFQPGGPAARWAKYNGLADGVVFHGTVSHSELVIAIKEATLMLHPSRSESCPMGIAEALALGLPVIGGGKSGGVPWMVGEAGLLVDIDKPLEIAHAALQLLVDDVRYAKCVTAARQRVISFAPELIASKYEQIYMRILTQARVR